MKNSSITKYIVLASFLFLTVVLHAQVQLTLKRVVPFSDHVELYYHAECNGENITKVLTENDFRVFENGEEVTDFTHECLYYKCPSSVVLVVSGGGEEQGNGALYTRIGALHMVDSLTPGIDEMGLIIPRDTAEIYCALTTDIDSIRRSIDRYYNEIGGTGLQLRLGIETAIMELAAIASNPCKTIIFKVGENTVQDFVTLFFSTIRAAQEEHIRLVYVLDRNAQGLWQHYDSLATRTGGVTYDKSWIYTGGITPEDYPEAFRRALEFTHNGYDECMLSYPLVCPDGTERTIDVEVDYHCDGKVYRDKKSIQYTAPPPHAPKPPGSEIAENKK